MNVRPIVGAPWTLRVTTNAAPDPRGEWRRNKQVAPIASAPGACSLGRVSVNVLVVICNDIICKGVLACHGVSRLANHDVVSVNKVWNTKVEHCVVIGTKDEHIPVRIQAMMVAS